MIVRKLSHTGTEHVLSECIRRVLLSMRSTGLEFRNDLFDEIRERSRTKDFRQIEPVNICLTDPAFQ